LGKPLDRFPKLSEFLNEWKEKILRGEKEVKCWVHGFYRKGSRERSQEF
jgi:hypothetical protein